MIDWRRIAELKSELGADSFANIVALFLAEIDNDLTALSVIRDDLPSLRDALHGIKGCALNIGFTELAELCAEGERTLSAGGNWSDQSGALRAAFDRSSQSFRAGPPRNGPAPPFISGDATAPDPGGHPP